MEGNSNGFKQNTKLPAKGSQKPTSSPSVKSQTKKQFTPKIPEQPFVPKSATPSSNTTNDNNNNTNDGIIRIKRKRDDSALDSFVIEDEPDYKKVTLSSITDQLSKVSVEDDKKPTYHFSETKPSPQPTEPSPKPINTRKLFRFAYTITDAEKLKEHKKGLLKIQSITKRDQVVASKRGQTTSSEETYVIDVYVQDTNVLPDSELMDQFDVVRLESFKEDLVFDKEYDSDNDSDDSNAENHYGNEYPDEEEIVSDHSFSDDSEKETINSRIRFDSDDEYDDYDDPYVKPDLTKFEKFLKDDDSENSSEEDAMESEDTRKPQPPVHLTFTPRRNNNGKSQPNNVFQTLKMQQIADKKKQKEKMSSYYDDEPNANDYNYEIASSSDSDFDQ